MSPETVERRVLKRCPGHAHQHAEEHAALVVHWDVCVCSRTEAGACRAPVFPQEAVGTPMNPWDILAKFQPHTSLSEYHLPWCNVGIKVKLLKIFQ